LPITSSARVEDVFLLGWRPIASFFWPYATSFDGSLTTFRSPQSKKANTHTEVAQSPTNISACAVKSVVYLRTAIVAQTTSLQRSTDYPWPLLVTMHLRCIIFILK
jgi:hypothetical protein